MNPGEGVKTIRLPTVHEHGKDCGDGSCGCGCGIPLGIRKVSETVGESEECCEPICGPEACG